MKKAALALAIVLSVAAAMGICSCKGQTDYFSYVSELRSDLFAGEKDDFCVTVYSGMKEKPFAHDGTANQAELCLSVKLVMREKINEAVTVKLEYDGAKYEKTLEYNPVLTTLAADIYVQALPENKITVTVTHGEQATVIEAVSKRLPDTVEYVKALAAATDKAKDFIKENSTGGAFDGEICLRLLCEGERNYYYVGFILKNGLALAYLIDGKTCEIIAEKKV